MFPRPPRQKNPARQPNSWLANFVSACLCLLVLTISEAQSTEVIPDTLEKKEAPESAKDKPEIQAPENPTPLNKNIGAIGKKEAEDHIPAVLVKLKNDSTFIRQFIVELLFLCLTLFFFLFLIPYFIRKVIKELKRTEIILDALVVPEELVKSGYTGTVVAEKLLDAAHDIVFKTQALSKGKTWHKETMNMVKMETEARMPDIQIPGASFTLRSLFRYIRQILGFKSTYLRGEVTQSEKGVSLTLRSISDHTPAIQLSVKDDLDQLIKEYGGEALLKIIKPQTLAIHAYHQFEKQVSTSNPHDESFQKLNEIIDYCLEYTPPSDHLLVIYILGSALFILKRYDDAIAMHQKAIEMDPKFSYAYYGWGVALCDLKRYEDAIVQFQKTIEIDPKSAYAYNGWGSALDDLKRHKNAIEKYQKAVEINPKFAFAYFNWGNALDDLKRHEDAIEKYQKAVEIDPKLAFTYYNWGNALNRLKRHEDAIVQYKKAVELAPEFAHAYSNWGIVLRKLGRYEEADAKFQKATELEQAQSDNGDPAN